MHTLSPRKAYCFFLYIFNFSRRFIHTHANVLWGLTKLASLAKHRKYVLYWIVHGFEGILCDHCMLCCMILPYFVFTLVNWRTSRLFLCRHIIKMLYSCADLCVELHRPWEMQSLSQMTAPSKVPLQSDIPTVKVSVFLHLCEDMLLFVYLHHNW